jgi:hypothetical protein
MRFVRSCTLTFAALVPLLAPTAHADGKRSSAGGEPALRQTALKDCTRLNGRVGYYGNPWCTPAEQRAWDLRDARRHQLSAGN